VNRNELINYIILNSKISLEDIAQNIGVNRSNIYLWRTNKTTPKIEFVNKMANLAGLTLKWINQDEIIIENTDSDYTEMKNDNSKDKIISLQDGTIKLLEEKIETLKKKIRYQKLS
jgi:transcriptional regulator with XRE-family HTH domain